jgi:tight adherence protein C
MLTLPLVLALSSLALLGISVAELVPRHRRAVLRRLAELEFQGRPKAERRAVWWRELREEIVLVLKRLGGTGEGAGETIAARLVHAGFHHPQSAAIYRGACVIGLAAGATACFVPVTVMGGSLLTALGLSLYGAILGWLAPRWYVLRRAGSRQSEIQRSLPDALDLMVVCMEAGLGLNNALQRVAEEIGTVSAALGDELRLVNLEIRAGSPRQEALRALGDRTGLDDLRQLSAMLIQTERFGTPVAEALRTHSESLRTKRRQRAEEAAAKTTVKLLFPLVLFIFPPLYIIILGPAILLMLRSMGNL